MPLSDIPFFLIPAALAAHTQSELSGFRQRDVRFFSELFSNWVQFGGLGAIYSIHNTQVLRFLRSLCEDHNAKMVSRGKVPKYRLTRSGVFNLISFMVNRSYLNNKAECLLSCYFLKSYAEQLKVQVATSAQDFSKAHRIEIEALLDLSKFVERQISLIDNEVVRLTERIKAAKEIDLDYQGLKERGLSLEGIAKQIGVKHPYELNSMKNFSELLQSLSNDVLEWEVSKGFALRSILVFSPLKDDLVRFRDYLQSFLLKFD